METDRTSRRRAAPAALALMAASLLVGLAIGEGAVRILRPQFVAGPDPIRNPFWRHDPMLGWSHTPGAEGVFTRDEFSHHVRINGSGWRDRERTREKPAGLVRVAVLGDSFTWGHGVEDEEIYTRVMERLQPGVEVLNFGLSGSATDQQLLILREHALAHHPDLVLAMVSRNDFAGNTQTMEGTYPKPRFVLEADGSLTLTNVPVPDVTWWSRFHSRLRRRSALLNLVESTLESEPVANPTGARQAQYAITCALLAQMNRDAGAGGARFAAALAPSNAHTYLDPIPPVEAGKYAAVIDCGAKEGFPVLDLVPAFRSAARAGGRTELHYRFDHHWNAAGHALAAAELSRLLRREGLLPAPAP